MHFHLFADITEYTYDIDIDSIYVVSCVCLEDRKIIIATGLQRGRQSPKKSNNYCSKNLFVNERRVFTRYMRQSECKELRTFFDLIEFILIILLDWFVFSNGYSFFSIKWLSILYSHKTVLITVWRLLENGHENPRTTMLS